MDGRLDITLSRPGGSGPGTNPEQLLAAGWSACFIGSMGLAARAAGVTLPDGVMVDAEVDLGKSGDGFALQARLTIGLPDLDPVIARAIVNSANQLCPYSKAMHGNIAISINLL